MAIINLIQDVVINAVNEVIKNDRTIKDSGTNKDDIITYVLNRVPPKYITSERGILHGALDAKFLVQERMDILKLVYEAVREIKNRRSSQSISNDEIMFDHIRLPHIIGTVLEETTLSIIPNVEVSLYYKKNLAEMVYSEWENPYKSYKATMGYYHFWPKYKKEEMGDHSTFTLRFHHPKFNDSEIEVKIEPLNGSDVGKPFVAPIVLLTAKEGMNLDFLYEE